MKDCTFKPEVPGIACKVHGFSRFISMWTSAPSSHINRKETTVNEWLWRTEITDWKAAKNVLISRKPEIITFWVKHHLRYETGQRYNGVRIRHWELQSAHIPLILLIDCRGCARTCLYWRLQDCLAYKVTIPQASGIKRTFRRRFRVNFLPGREKDLHNNEQVLCICSLLPKWHWQGR